MDHWTSGGERIRLRVVSQRDQAIVEFDEAADRARAVRAVRSEAAAFAAAHGSNAYSDFLLKHGHRPDPEQASIIGRLMGTRVIASDGKLHPQMTKGQRDALAAQRRVWRDRRRKVEELARLSAALSFVTANQHDPASLLSELCDPYETEIVANLENAIEWLRRFATEWQRHVEATGRTSDSYRDRTA